MKIDKRVVKEVFTNFYGYFVIFLLLFLGYFISKSGILGFSYFVFNTLGPIPFWAFFGIINILTIFFGYKFLIKKQDKILFLVVLVIAIIFDYGILAGFVHAMG